MEKLRTDTGQTLGVVGLILGILTLLLDSVPRFGIAALLPGIIAITLSSIGLSQAKKHNGAKSLNIIALVMSIAGTLIAGTLILLEDSQFMLDVVLSL